MKCEKFEELAILYLENRVKKEEKEKIEEHLRSCKNCKEYLFFVKELLSNKRFKEDKIYWEDLKESIINKIKCYLQILDIRKLIFKKGLITIFLSFSLIFAYFIKIQIERHITKYYHLYKDYEIIQNLDQLKEMIEYENEEYVENE